MKKLLTLTFITIILISGCIYNYQLEVPETRTWSEANISQIEVRTDNGEISVSAIQDTVISANITKRCRGKDKADAEKYINNVVVEETIIGNRLSLTTEMPDVSTRNYGCDFSVTAKESIYLDLNTSNGKVTISGMKSGANVSTSNGALNLSNTNGKTVLKTSNGKIIIQAHSRSMKAQTSNGQIECDIAGMPINDSCELRTSNGKVILSLPSNIAAGFEASTSNGQVTLTGFGSVNYSRNERIHKSGSIGNIGTGKSIIIISTSNGDVTIRAR